MTRLVNKYRSKWKGKFISIFPLNISNVNKTRLRKMTYVTDRASVIGEFLIGRNVKIHQGAGFVKKIVTKEMVGHRFGEFTLTSKMGSGIHKTAKNLSKNKLVSKLTKKKK